MTESTEVLFRSGSSCGLRFGSNSSALTVFYASTMRPYETVESCGECEEESSPTAKRKD